MTIIIIMTIMITTTTAKQNNKDSIDSAEVRAKPLHEII